MPNILVLGDGLLGLEIVKQTNWDYISRKKDYFDFNDFSSYEQYLIDYDQIINTIANTNTYSLNREDHWLTNYKSVIDLVTYCKFCNKKLVQISTDYLYANSVREASENDVPVHARNWYSYTKLLADGYIQAVMENYLIIRCSFKKYPFPYSKAFPNQFGNFEYVNTIAEMIVELVKKNAIGIYNVGGKLKSMYELALKSDLNIEPIWDFPDSSFPEDVSMNIDKMNKFLDKKI